MQNCYRGYQSHLKHLLTWLTERLFLYPVSVQRKRPDCSAEQPPSDVLFIRFISHWNVYGAFTCIQALKWMSCTWLQRLWPPAVCVLLLSFSPQCRSMEARGRQTGSHSPLQCAIVQPGKKKINERARQKSGRKKGRTRVQTNPSGAVFHLPLIFFKGVCVRTTGFGLVLLFCFFFQPQPPPENLKAWKQ